MASSGWLALWRHMTAGPGSGVGDRDAWRASLALRAGHGRHFVWPPAVFCPGHPHLPVPRLSALPPLQGAPPTSPEAFVITPLGLWFKMKQNQPVQGT